MPSVNNRLGFVEPLLLTSTDQPPQGSNWIHEVKHDGYRTLLVIERGTARAYTRNGFDWSDRYPDIVSAAGQLPCRFAILDGETIVQNDRGVSDFEALRSPYAGTRTSWSFTRSTFSTWMARICATMRRLTACYAEEANRPRSL